MVFQETAISWNHAQIYWGGTSGVLEDLNSTNGTYGLGQRISLAEAGRGSVFRLGRVSARWDSPVGHRRHRATCNRRHRAACNSNVSKGGQ